MIALSDNNYYGLVVVLAQRKQCGIEFTFYFTFYFWHFFAHRRKMVSRNVTSNDIHADAHSKHPKCNKLCAPSRSSWHDSLNSQMFESCNP